MKIALVVAAMVASLACLARYVSPGPRQEFWGGMSLAFFISMVLVATVLP